MQKLNLEDVESYLLKRAKDIPDWMGPKKVRWWIRTCFAELRAREKD